ncbi:MAG: protein-(glutamine-N5) methyltransferase, release factor-specific [Cycloclasticus sp. symbiont of Bathymodiolus heckerae]|nr:MAG: protein-(glutamine-N5) methyltransferase, release factor-specific [Cycloclasticus sp. symbiont of Bathymodiolus heckerae]
MNSPTTIKKALSDAANTLLNSDSPNLDSEVLLAHVLNKRRSHFRAWPEKMLSANDHNSFTQLIEKRLAGTPIAYLIGEREFWSRPFKVSADVLIPRPDTELLIEVVLQKFKSPHPITFMDMGTGSGVIGITLALELSNARITATDSSSAALGIAQENAFQLNAKNVEFINSNWFSNIPNQTFDLIVSNPPYICSNDPHLHEGDVRFEPPSALIAKHSGLQDFEVIAAKAPHFLKPDGILLFEHGYQQGEQVQSLLESSGFKAIEQFQDIQGHTRATLGIKS